MREVYDTVRRASDAMIAAIGDGVPARVPHEKARQVIRDAGLDGHRVHMSGYALGAGFPPSWAEQLMMIGDSQHVLRAGMVVTVEPPVFIGAEGLGARIIDCVLVTEKGAEPLSHASRDLIIVE
jgi:Xaa-Pro dipeptidase